MADYVLSPFAPEDDAEAIVDAGLRRGRDRSSPRASRRRSAASTEPPAVLVDRHGSTCVVDPRCSTRGDTADRHTPGHDFLASVSSGHRGAPWVVVVGGLDAVASARDAEAAARAAGWSAPVRWPRGARSPPNAWTSDPHPVTPLTAFVDELAAQDASTRSRTRCRRARASRSRCCRSLLAALHEQLGRGLLVLLPEDADARDAAEAAGWFLGGERVALLPEPRRPLRLGSRAAAASRRRALPRARRARRRRARLRVGARARRGAAAACRAARRRHAARRRRAGRRRPRGGARARRLRARRPRRGARPVRRPRRDRRRVPVDRPRAASRRALRRRDRAGARVLAVHPARAAHGRRRGRVSGGRAPRRPRRARPRRTTTRDRAGAARDLVPPVDRAPDIVWQPDEVARGLGGGGARRRRARRRHASSTRSRAASRSRSRRSGPRSPPAASPRPRTSSRRSSAAGNRVVVAFPHRGEAQRQRRCCARSTAPLLEPGEAARRRRRRARSPSAPARRGFVWRELGLVLLPDTQVFRKRPPRADARLGRALASFADLRVGDYVVHEDHGVGKLLGFETKEVADVTRDYLFLAFRGDDRLYVPHEQLGKLSRYIGADADGARSSRSSAARRGRTSRRAPASRCGSSPASCSRSTRSASAPRGRRSTSTSDWLERLEASFPYRETDDQQRAIEAVKEDLEAARPMDRLVCGDVGFGKTEVAVRAAFAVAANGRQVLVLCPTTILAEQHWNTFRERYRDFPVRVEMVSRFRRPAEAKQVLAEFAGGQGRRPGRHASRPLARRDPEEARARRPRRGAALRRRAEGAPARAAARGRRARAVGDADPAHAAHVALRAARHLDHRDAARGAAADPHDRRRVRRGADRSRSSASTRASGQSFYLHNRVETIDEAAEKLQQLCPGLRFLVAHGQMGERELEERMHAFLAGDADVLVSTTIIESGIDIPQANTLVVERADTLGLAQLYQIRGRVGRSDVTAHAYLFYPDASELTPEARARLATLADHTELGAGFQIAMRDLEIRGAGDLLGAEQSGHVAALGFELYVEMLNEAVAELSGQARVAARPVRVDARVDAFVPASYISSEALKIDLHRRLALVGARRRAPRAARRDRGPLRAAAGARREPVRDPGGEARSSRGSAPTTSSSAAGGPPSGRSSSARGELRALRAVVDTAVYTIARAGRSRCARTISRGRSGSPLLSLRRAWPPEHGPFRPRSRAPNGFRTQSQPVPEHGAQL